MDSHLLARPKRWPVAGLTDESFRGRALRVRLSDIVSLVREQMSTIEYEYEPDHPHGRVAYSDPASLEGGGVVDASEVSALSVAQRRSMMVLGPYGHVACGTDDMPIYYAGNMENRRRMEALQEALEARGQYLVDWRRIGAVGAVAATPVVLVVGAVAVLVLTTEDAPPAAWVLTIAIGLVGAISALIGFRPLLALNPRPHKLLLS